MRLLICAGGTGGGVYPALAVYPGLHAERSGVETLWVGGEGGMEAELVKRAGIPFTSIPAAGLHGVGLRALPRNLLQLARGAFASRQILRDFRPDVLFFTGGFVAGPMAFAARFPLVPRAGFPRFCTCRISSRAWRCSPSPVSQTGSRSVPKTSQKYFKTHVVVTGYPVRPELSAWTRQSGRRALDLDDRLPVLLIVGGSKGARSINQAVMASLPKLLDMAQVVHVTGQLDWENLQQAGARLTPNQRERYHAYPYLHEEMGAALAAADLAVMRAGASTLGELPFMACRLCSSPIRMPGAIKR